MFHCRPCNPSNPKPERKALELVCLGHLRAATLFAPHTRWLHIVRIGYSAANGARPISLLKMGRFRFHVERY